MSLTLDVGGRHLRLQLLLVPGPQCTSGVSNYVRMIFGFAADLWMQPAVLVPFRSGPLLRPKKLGLEIRGEFPITYFRIFLRFEKLTDHRRQLTVLCGESLGKPKLPL